ncbi:Cof-type HAD-IIB family hydrolase [Gemmiger sp. An50]|uniref:Cof-type HAD-IIB family hydrolase n=1 Tax=Gemmiger sp. An50 TaxID=1965639 RepID=UPI000B37A6DB|nr:Cof-type HAD-IIB family hydrolase [Gemmiger sp. An50]OUN83106.1 hypothetical protein B5G03_16025 [Gemmiger sp. An50]
MSEYNIKLVGLDIDGTLLNTKNQISPRNHAAIRAAIDAGCRVIPATGRPLRGVLPEFIQIPGVDYAVTANGATVVRLSDGEFVIKNWLSRARLQKLYEATQGLWRVFDVFVGGSGYSEKKNLDAAEEWAPRNMAPYMRISRQPVESIPDFIAAQEGFEKCSMFFTSEENRQKVRQIAQEMGGFSIVSSESNNLEISDEGATKGLALLELGRMLGLEKSQVMACGDSENDLPMLETVGLGVAMGNAPRFIQEKAAAVTATNDEDGVALALEKYVLGR